MRFIKKSALSFFIPMSILFVFLLSACGGGGGGTTSYDNPDEEYYAGDQNESALIEPDTLYHWIKNGYKTENGDPVLIVQILNNPGDENIWFKGDVSKVAKLVPGGLKAAQALDDAGYLGHIPGAVYAVSHEGYLTPNRNDGPMDTDHLVGTGDLVTQWLRKLGVTKKTVIVLTQGHLMYPGFCPARVYWTLRYWGMSKKHVKILNGNKTAWADYIKKQHADEISTMGLQKGLTLPKITPSTIDVADFPKKNLNIRVTIGELISYVDSGQTTNGSIALLDGRQPPSPFYFSDINSHSPVKHKLKTPNGNGMPEWSDTAFMPIDFNGMDTNKDGNTANASVLRSFVKNGFPYPVNLSAKAAAFDGEIKGTIMIKGKNPSGMPFNIAAPAVAQVIPVKYNNAAPAFLLFGKYKDPNAIAWPRADWNNDGTPDRVTVANMFSRAFPDKNQTIITYCNSGAMAAFYWLYMTEVLGYKDVRLYDGSWIEWGSSVAFEPNNAEPNEGLKVVRSEVYSWFPKTTPAATLNMPKLLIFGSGDFTFFHIEQENGKYYAVSDEMSSTTFNKCEVGTPGCPVKFGGNLAGNPTWDTISRSERVVFRPNSLVNTGIAAGDNISSTKEHNSITDWPLVTTYPDYNGEGSETKIEDEGYNGYVGGGSGGSAPEAFVPQGGGC